MLAIAGVEVPAICDINCQNLARAQSLVEKAGQKKPEGYGRDEQDYQRLMYRDDLDAVLIATNWEWHTPMAVCAMKAGKYTAVEVPAALTVEECWELVDTHEETGVPCMMLENWSFRRDNLAVLKVIREGLLGEIVHCHCAHSHNCIDHWFFDPHGNMRWGGKYLVQRNCSQYPTHALGPVLSWMDIGCGDYFATTVSFASRSLGINHYFAKKFGADHPNAKRKYAQGDIVTTLVKTQKGNTIVINYDMQLPRPYDDRWMIQGTEGVYVEGLYKAEMYGEQKHSIYLNGRSPKYQEWEPFDPYQVKYEHAWWKSLGQKALQAGHGGADYMELYLFLEAVRIKSQTPLDVYDSVAMSVIIPLSQQSIAKGGAPVECPDFTRGKWKTRKPAFALEV
jgi:predicted dehydrogenase